MNSKLTNLVNKFKDKVYLKRELTKMIDDENYMSDEEVQQFVTDSVHIETRRANFSNSFNKPSKEFLSKLLEMID